MPRRPAQAAVKAAPDTSSRGAAMGPGEAELPRPRESALYRLPAASSPTLLASASSPLQR